MSLSSWRWWYENFRYSALFQTFFYYFISKNNMLKNNNVKPPIHKNVRKPSPQNVRKSSHHKVDNKLAVLRLPTQDELPCEDGTHKETEQHRLQMELLINSLKPWLAKHEGGYVNGNMFIYFSPKQVRSQYFKGPDVFVVRNVSSEWRKSWVVWDECKGPDIVIELLSESTADIDKGEKKTIYQNKLKVPEYYWFDPLNSKDWAGFILKHGVYQEIPVDDQNRLISKELGLALTRWHGVYQGGTATWLRWETLDGELLPTPQEIAELAEKRAEAETKRADAAEQKADIAKQKADIAKQEADAVKQEADAAKQKAEAAYAEIARLKALLTEKM
jgi:Uma2 family endonuclease